MLLSSYFPCTPFFQFSNMFCAPRLAWLLVPIPGIQNRLFLGMWQASCRRNEEGRFVPAAARLLHLLDLGRPRGERRMGVQDLPFLCDSCLPASSREGDLINQKTERGKRDVVPAGGCCRAPAAVPSLRGAVVPRWFSCQQLRLCFSSAAGVLQCCWIHCTPSAHLLITSWLPHIPRLRAAAASPIFW